MAVEAAAEAEAAAAVSSGSRFNPKVRRSSNTSGQIRVLGVGTLFLTQSSLFSAFLDTAYTKIVISLFARDGLERSVNEATDWYLR